MKQHSKTKSSPLTELGVRTIARVRAGSSLRQEERARTTHIPAGCVPDRTRRWSPGGRGKTGMASITGPPSASVPFSSKRTAARRADGPRVPWALAPGFVERSETRSQTVHRFLARVIPAATLAAAMTAGCSDDGRGSPATPSLVRAPSATSSANAAAVTPAGPTSASRSREAHHASEVALDPSVMASSERTSGSVLTAHLTAPESHEGTAFVDDLPLADPLAATIQGAGSGCNRNRWRDMAGRVSATDSLDTAGDCDWFRWWVNSGERYRVTLEGLSIDRRLAFRPGARGSRVPRTKTRITRDADKTEIHFTPGWNGGLFIRVSSSALETGEYTLSFERDPVMVYNGSEPPDLPGDTSTWAEVEAGDTVDGTYLCQDTDWYRINLDANESVQVDLAPVMTTNNSADLLDPVLRILAADGTLLESGGSYVIDDDSGGGVGGKDARVTFGAGSSAVTRYIEASFGRLVRAEMTLAYTGEVRLSPFCGDYVLSVAAN